MRPVEGEDSKTYVSASRVLQLYIYYQYLLESAGFHQSKLINSLETHIKLLLSSKMTLSPSLNLLLRYCCCTESSVVAVNHHSNPGIDCCGWLSLQKKTYKGEVKLSCSIHATILYTCLDLFRVIHWVDLISVLLRLMHIIFLIYLQAFWIQPIFEQCHQYLYICALSLCRMDLPPPFKPPPPPVRYTAARHHDISTQSFPTSRCNSVTELKDMKQVNMYIY